LHIPEKNRKETHWDYYDGNKKIEGERKNVEENFKMAPMAVINNPARNPGLLSR